MKTVRDTPATANESPVDKYERLLTEGVEAQVRYVQLGKRISDLWQALEKKPKDPDIKTEIDRLETEGGALEKNIHSMLDQRATLLRRIEGLKTIEDAYPLVRRKKGNDELAADSEDVRAAYADESPKPKQPRTNTQIEEAWTQQDWDAFNRACEDLAREHGYEMDEQYAWWKKGEYSFSPTILPFPSDVGMSMAKNSRLKRLSVQRNGESIAYYDRSEWDEIPLDTAAQREVDRLLAIFG